MNDTQKKLLERGLIVLPEEVDHDVYEMVLEALVVDRPAEEVRVYCLGKGGSTRVMLGIVDLIAQHGNCVGVLVGAALSSHSAIWTACQRRYVSPNASIGIHKVAWTDLGQVDSRDARLLTLDSERTEQIISELLARISGKPSSHWYDMMQDAGSNGCKLIEAATLIKLGMAHPLADLGREPAEVRRVPSKASVVG